MVGSWALGICGAVRHPALAHLSFNSKFPFRLTCFARAPEESLPLFRKKVPLLDGKSTRMPAHAATDLSCIIVENLGDSVDGAEARRELGPICIRQQHSSSVAGKVDDGKAQVPLVYSGGIQQ